MNCVLNLVACAWKMVKHLAWSMVNGHAHLIKGSERAEVQLQLAAQYN